MLGTWLGGVGVYHGVSFSFGAAKVCSPAKFRTCFSYDKDTWIVATDLLYVLLHNYAIPIDIYSPVNEFYSVIIFYLLINAVILLLNCLVLTLHLYIIFFLLDIFFST